MNAVQLYFRYIGLALRGQLQYRAALLMQALGTLGVTVIEFVGIAALFQRFGNLRGWTLPEVGLLYGLVEVAFALSHGLARGLETFPGLVLRGDFDRLLLRPRSTVLQILGGEVAIQKVGRAAQGLAVLLWAASVLDVAWTVPRVGLLLAAIVGGALVFCGIHFLGATAAFWTVEPLEVVNAFSDGGAFAGHYPMPIYRRWFRVFFTYVIPIACVNYLPGLAILGRADPLGLPPLAGWLGPLAALLFFVVTTQIFRLGVRRYRSTGS